MKNKKIIGNILSLLTYLALLIFVVYRTPNHNLNFNAYIPYLKYIASGFMLTILVSILIFVFSFILGGVFFLASMSRSSYIKSLINHFTLFMFGTPMLVLVIISYFFISAAFGLTNKIVVGTITLTLYFTPFMMKLYQGSYDGIDKNQILICDIFGFTKFQMYYYVIFPQMIRTMMPPLSGNLATIVKSSSLLYLLGVGELYYSLTNVQAKTLTYTAGFLNMIVLYLIITIPLIKLSDLLEKRIKL